MRANSFAVQSGDKRTTELVSSRHRRHFSLSAFSLLSAVCIASVVQAGSVAESFKLTADDATPADRFGRAIAAEGNLVAIGSGRDGEAGAFSGCVYLFDASVGQQLSKLTASDAAAQDGFGLSVAADGGYLLVGAPGDDDVGSASGSVYLFDLNTGQELLKMTASDGAPFDNFGATVAIHGQYAVISSPRDDDGGQDSGSVYVFDVNTGQELHKLTVSDPEPNHDFRAVAVYGTLAVIGASTDEDNGHGSGAAYVFDIVTGQQLSKLTPLDAEAEDRFGYSVALHENIAVIGAFGEANPGLRSGAAYVFDVVTGEQLQKLRPCDLGSGDAFGYSVALDGTTALIGSYRADIPGFYAGSAYVFDVTTGAQLFKLRASDGDEFDEFGNSVELTDSYFVVGAHENDDAGSNSGSAYIFVPLPGDGCPGDLNDDGAINLGDLNQVLGSFGQDANCGDTNGDGQVDLADLNLVLANFGTSCG
jgi:outer membrane protein assembly factor BamB